jgi:hypothetical protein
MVHSGRMGNGLFRRHARRHRSIDLTAPSRQEVAAARAFTSASLNHVADRLNHDVRLIPLYEVAAVVGDAKLSLRRSLREILLKSSPGPIPRHELLLGHAVRL